MPTLTVLGSANALSDAEHESTHLLVKGDERVILIDCVNNPIWRMQRAGVGYEDLTDLILTHFHPDHVSGVPTLMINLWLLGRKRPLNVYGLAHTLERVENLLMAYRWKRLDNFYPVFFHPIPEQDDTLAFETREFRVIASPVRHFLPTIGLRIEFPQVQQAMAYSCDTLPCPQVIALGKEVDVLLHEANGLGEGHSSAAQAGRAATLAHARSLYLIHYPVWEDDPTRLIPQAQSEYDGPVALAEDFMQLEFNGRPTSR